MWAMTLWRTASWRFDLRSALVGALVAWAIAWMLYRRRAVIGQRLEQLRAPFKRWWARNQRSTGEKYLAALQEQLRRLLLFAPEDPLQVFVPPQFLTPAALPTTLAEADDTSPTLLLSHEALLHGHTRLSLYGEPGTGRTTALATLVWRIAEHDLQQQRPYQRFPLWIDLALVSELPDAKTAPVQALADMATRFMPQALPKWLVAQLRTQPSLILVDNWDATPLEQRRALAEWLNQAAAALPQSLWILAAVHEGYGPLVEAGFTPLQIQPALDRDTPVRLHTGWSHALGLPEAEFPEEDLAIMRWAIAAGDTLAEQTLRINLYLRYQQMPYRPVEVLEALLRTLYLPISGLEDAPENIPVAQELAITLLAQLARVLRLEKRPVTPALLQELLERLTPLTDKQDKLPAIVRKAIQSTPLLDHSGKSVHFIHPLWEDFLTARALAAETAETNQEPILLLEHLYDPEWRFLLECYAGLSDAEPLIKALLREGLTLVDQPDARRAQEALLLAARWTARSPEDVPWRSYVIKALVQVIMKPALDAELRLRLAEALALVAGEEAYPFYQLALRQPALPVRLAALRGIGWTGGVKDLKLLSAAFRDPHREVQEAALRAIGDLGIPEAYRFLAQLLPQASDELMLVIAEILARQPESWGLLNEATTADDLLVRRAAAYGLGFIREPWAQERLQQLARDDSQWLVRSAAEASLSAQQPSTHVALAPPQPEYLQWLMAWAAKHGLGLGVGEAALQLLLHAVQVGDATSRILAARTLSQIGRPEHLPTLQALSEEQDPAVQQAAMQAIRQIESRYRGIPEPPAPAPESTEPAQP